MYSSLYLAMIIGFGGVLFLGLGFRVLAGRPQLSIQRSTLVQVFVLQETNSSEISKKDAKLNVFH